MEISISNSVTGPPVAVVVSPDGRYAVVGERLGQRPQNKTAPLLDDLLPARTLTVVDLADPDKPKIVQQVNGPERANALSFSGDGSLLAVASYPTDNNAPPLTVYRFLDGRLFSPSTPKIPNWTAGDILRHAAFHPTENVLALVNFTESSVTMFRLANAGNQMNLTKWGNPVGVDKAPFLTRFAPDGRHLIINGSFGALDVRSQGAGAPRGTVSTIRIASGQTTDGTPRHELISRAFTGVNPEGMNVSPDGRWVVTTNIERSAEPLDSPRQGFFSSLTLIRLDSESGLLERVGDFTNDGLLPESAVFDASSRYLAVTTFSSYDEKRRGGSVDFWRIATDYFDPKRVELVKTGYSVSVTRGAHTLDIAR